MARGRRRKTLVERLVLGANPVRRAIYLFGMAPATWYFWLGLQGQLGIDPQNMLERLLGLWALRFLILSLAITPLRRLSGFNLIPYRRAVGLLAFYYGVLHLGTYMVLDQNLGFSAIAADIVRRPYITIGMVAFSILVPLAITSNNVMIRRLGGARWRILHRLVYVAAAAAALHFVMIGKVWQLEPLIYAALVVVVLGMRPAFSRRGIRLRRILQPPPA